MENELESTLEKLCNVICGSCSFKKTKGKLLSTTASLATGILINGQMFIARLQPHEYNEFGNKEHRAFLICTCDSIKVKVSKEMPKFVDYPSLVSLHKTF